MWIYRIHVCKIDVYVYYSATFEYLTIYALYSLMLKCDGITTCSAWRIPCVLRPCEVKYTGRNNAGHPLTAASCTEIYIHLYSPETAA